jgi:16S rRNA (guanine1516-N2)-methyltransferase
MSQTSEFSTHPNIIAVRCSEEHLKDQARRLAKKLECPFVDTVSTDYQFYLLLTEERLELWRAGDRRPIYVDFLHGAMKYRRLHGGGQHQLIARACAVKKSFKPKVVDLTAGLGRDAYVLASLGCKVIMIERSKIIAALLKDGLERLKADPVFSKGIDLTFYEADAKQWLQTLDEHALPDIIYLDPMFPLQKKSAMVKKEMQYLQAVLGKEDDSEELLKMSLPLAKKRIVVKRPRLAKPIANKAPDISYKGQSTRFDVYLSCNVNSDLI